ncbi:MAG: hypothetical protein DI626_00510 [Micavibrio aeruginosavorus]|uniref:Uncharacterized protein n=1 Tax=Micavibrio aeruginosavorus TaxID=349221 RepID=A0A2W5A690_9BACT|nr:MAG: hypothetical protein DI626_00510 [Micavibrio aeruginosavorus]
MFGKRLSRVFQSAALAAGLMAGAAANAVEQPDIDMEYRSDRASLLKDGRLKTLGINNFGVVCPEGIYAPKGGGNAPKTLRIELNSVTFEEMLREGRDLAATREHDKAITEEPLTGSQFFAIGSDGKFKQFSTMSDIISLAEDWERAGKPPKGISPDDKMGMARIERFGRDFCGGM